MPTSFPRSRLLPASTAALLAFAGLGAVAALASGCKSKLVEGNRPVMAELLDGQTGLVMDQHVVQICVPESLILKVTFSDGSIANFGQRANTTWTSSDPTVVQVSTGIQTFGGANGGSFVTGAGGVLVPQANGTATVTANYQGLTASTQVRVAAAPSDIRLVRNDLDPYRTGPGLTASQTQTLAPNSALGFDVYATVRGIEQRLSSQAEWDLTTADTSVAVLGAASTGSEVVSGIAASNTTQVLTARPPACGVTLATNIAVTTPTKVSLAREFTGPLRVSTLPTLQPVERFLLTASFPNGATQDVSPYGAFTSSDGSVLLFGGQSTGSRNYGVGIAAGTSTVGATFNATTDSANATALLTANSVDVPLVSDTLTGLAITTPASKALTLAPGKTAPFRVTGTFASGQSQDITRRTVFTSTDPSLAGVFSGSTDIIDAGNVVAGTTPTNGTYGSGGTTTVTASFAGLTTTDVGTVTVPALVSP